MLLAFVFGLMLGVVVTLGPTIYFYHLAQQLERSIYDHAAAVTYRQDFTASLEIVEQLRRHGKEELVVDVLTSILQSQNNAARMSVMLILRDLGAEALRVLPLLKRIENDSGEMEAIRSDAAELSSYFKSYAFSPATACD